MIRDSRYNPATPKTVATVDSGYPLLSGIRHSRRSRLTVLPELTFKPEGCEGRADVFQLRIKSPAGHAESLACLHHRKILLQEQPTQFTLAWRPVGEGARQIEVERLLTVAVLARFVRFR